MRCPTLTLGALITTLLNGAHASSILFTDATIISYDTATNRTQILHDSSLLVEDDRISEIYPNSRPDHTPNATQVVDCTGRIISPGFINSHHHLWQTALKTLGSNTTLTEYFQRYGEDGPTARYFTAEDKYLSQLVGALELLNAGTTTVVDHAHGDSTKESAEQILAATLESGIRAAYGFTIHQLSTNWTMQMQMEMLQALGTDKRFQGDSLVSLGLAFDYFDQAPEALINQLWSLVQSQNLSFVTTHYLGGPWISTNSPSRLSQLGWLNTTLPVIFSHASFIESRDMHMLRQHNQYISMTPESEMHYGHTHPYSYFIQDQGSLGVDTHFTFSADMVGQARIWLQSSRLRQFNKVLQEQKVPYNNPMSVDQAFHLITRAGALALRRDDLGIIAPGAKADLNIFDAESPNMLGGIDDPVAAIILHSNTGDIRDVLVNGQWRKRDGKLVFDGYADVKRRFVASAKRIQDIWRNMDWEDFWKEGLFQGVSQYGRAEVADVARGDGTGY